MTDIELFEKEVKPIVEMIENLFIEEETDHCMSLIALASILGTQIAEMEPDCFMDQLLRKFVQQNIKKIAERQTRESN